MAEFAPVTTVADFRRLDEGDILEGYLDGFHGAPEPDPTDPEPIGTGGATGGPMRDWLSRMTAQQALEEAFTLLRCACGQS